VTKEVGWTADEWYDFACTYAVAAGKMTKGAAGYADRAMAMLSKAVDAGWRDADHARADDDLVPINQGDDFTRLLAGLA
jgi:predicted alpha-1,6-mannanase (GH76 family)